MEQIPWLFTCWIRQIKDEFDKMEKFGQVHVKKKKKKTEREIDPSRWIRQNAPLNSQCINSNRSYYWSFLEKITWNLSKVISLKKWNKSQY